MRIIPKLVAGEEIATRLWLPGVPITVAYVDTEERVLSCPTFPSPTVPWSGSIISSCYLHLLRIRCYSYQKPLLPDSVRLFSVQTLLVMCMHARVSDRNPFYPQTTFFPSGYFLWLYRTSSSRGISRGNY